MTPSRPAGDSQACLVEGHTEDEAHCERAHLGVAIQDHDGRIGVLVQLDRGLRHAEISAPLERPRETATRQDGPQLPRAR